MRPACQTTPFTSPDFREDNNKYMKKDRPNKINIIPCNNGLLIESACRLPEIRFYEENGSVYFFASVLNNEEDDEIEALQYLTPEQAMKFARAMEKCAIEALKNSN